MTSKQTRETDYYVAFAEAAEGPYDIVGVFRAHGQDHAKRLAATELIETDPRIANYYFVAVPKSSWIPRRPKVEVRTQISFLDDEA